MSSPNCDSAIAMQMPTELFVETWPHIVQELDKIPHVWEPWYTKQHIFNSVLAGQFQVWGAGDNGSVKIVLFTQIVFYPAAKVLQGILVLGNSLDGCADAIWAATEKFAREHDCDRIEVLGRAGWERKLSRFGFRKVSVVLSVNVNETRMQ